MKKIILMLATIGAITFANAQAPAAGAKPATTPATKPAAAAPAQAVDPNAPEIKWETMKIDYGTVLKGDETNATRFFKFTNVGKTPLIIANCHGSCGCTVPTCPTDAPILPGKSGEIKVHYAVERMGGFTKQVTVNSNAKTPSETLTISGNVVEKPGAATAPATPATPVKK
jgi:hypothetical protein